MLTVTTAVAIGIVGGFLALANVAMLALTAWVFFGRPIYYTELRFIEQEQGAGYLLHVLRVECKKIMSHYVDAYGNQSGDSSDSEAAPDEDTDEETDEDTVPEDTDEDSEPEDTDDDIVSSDTDEDAQATPLDTGESPKIDPLEAME